ncbi:enhanced intracellular survival protein Eis [Streptomyces sp. NPDC088789]|uniref:GNAT family N-acetyltransferase n=1 Tax=Streptomyces sp. NPDC088789 TaxID=3365899 RepID=UPI0038297922
MPHDTPVTVVQADDQQRADYQALALRSYGQPVKDITLLGPHADLRVAMRGGRVIGGGLDLSVPQYFGGRPVPGVSLAAGCIAPEERGEHLWSLLLDKRLEAMKDRGAVLATAWSTSTGYGRRMGWAAGTPVFSWTVPTDELRRSFDDTGFTVTHADTGHGGPWQQELAARWNGPWQRPTWWDAWQQDVHPGLTHYRFALPGRDPDGLLSIDFAEHPGGGRCLMVHDFWAATARAAAAMLSFTGRHNSRIPTAWFQRTALPPAPLLHGLHRAGTATATSWHPWMLRILDAAKAVKLRGWPTDLDLTLPLTISTPARPTTYTLRIHGGHGELAPDSGPGHPVSLTERQFARWYAGGYRSPAAAALDGVDGDITGITRLVAAAGGAEPWLPEYF